MFRANLAGDLRPLPGHGGVATTDRHSDMTDELDQRRIDLEKRLSEKRVQSEFEQSGQSEGGKSGIAQAVKLSSEFVAGVLVGAGLGWGIDQLAGTTPFGLIVFLILGFLAGVLNVLRSVGAVAQPMSRGQGGVEDRTGAP